MSHDDDDDDDTRSCERKTRIAYRKFMCVTYLLAVMTQGNF